ncbi:ABC transporter substrate-binding protein [Paenibacillaceae bacterium WGS1546]|uniref:ABC transporter substrate-binding protein n=1 Tax=Cohnella sp. WGS1546 TaxID=3366810 RepID=UPI00372D0413
MKRLHKSAQLAIWFVCFALLLAACGSGGNDANAPSGTPAESPSTETQSASPESEDKGSFPVTITHMKGEYTLEKKPETIAVLDTKFVDQLIALNEQPAGSVTAAGSDTDFPEYLSDRLGDVKVLGTRDEPNIEAVLALNPDLILMTDFQEKAYDSISKIAPTLVLDFYEDWRATLETMGKITGKQAEAQAVRQAYEDKTSKLKQQLAEKLGDGTVALIRPRTEGIRIHTPQHRTGSILYTDLGLNVPVSVAAVDDTAYEISLEAIPEIGADHYFLLSDAMFAESVKELESTKIWSSMEPVKNNRVYPVDTTLWIAYYGPIANSLIVDQAVAALLGQP